MRAVVADTGPPHYLILIGAVDVLPQLFGRVLIPGVVASELLQRLGVTVETAADGLAAIERVRANGYDLVLMDMQMPVMDGPSAVRAIRALPGPRGQIPIIALTATVMSEQVAVCQAAGMQAHVAKPIQVHELVAAIMAQLSQPPVTAPASSSAEDRAPASAT